MDSRYWQAANVLRNQRTKFVFLTSGCCESTMDNNNGPRVFQKLNLSGSGFSQSEPHNTDTDFRNRLPEGQSFYPLTEKETKLIAEDCVETPGNTGFSLAYSGLYQGKKYITPICDVAWFDEKTNRSFSRGSYGPALYATRDEAKQEADKLVQFLAPKIERFGGKAMIVDEEFDRFDVALLVPMEVALQQKDYKGMKRFVVPLMKGYIPLPYTGAEN